VNVTGEVLAAILLVLAILKIVKKWQDEEILTIAMMRRNADVAREADRLLQSSSVNREAANQFLKRVQDFDVEDNTLLISIKEVDRQEAYRWALKEFDPSKVTVCPVCGADPWKFKRGSCQGVHPSYAMSNNAYPRMMARAVNLGVLTAH
jgi:mobilome CxxCx(11)CxxC protein